MDALSWALLPAASIRAMMLSASCCGVCSCRFSNTNQCIFSKRLNPVAGQYDNIIRLQPTGFIAQIDQLHYFSRYILRVEFASRVDEPTPR